MEVVERQHFEERLLGCDDELLVEDVEKPSPVLSERKSLVPGHLADKSLHRRSHVIHCSILAFASLSIPNSFNSPAFCKRLRTRYFVYILRYPARAMTV